MRHNNCTYTGASIGGVARTLLGLAMSVTILANTAQGQQKEPKADTLAYAADPANVQEAIEKVKTGEFLRVHVEMIAEARAVEAIPALKGQFVRSQDLSVKDIIANALVRLGEKDDTYWKFLIQEATFAIESDAPSFLRFDEHGRSLPGEPSQAFIDWSKAHNLPLEKAVEDALYLSPGAVMELASTGDPRSIPLLRRALRSPNYLIESTAALGLADVKDKDSIPSIVDACSAAPAEAAEEIAKSLIYFDDPQAQSAADKYIPQDVAKVYRAARAAGETPFGVK